MDERTRYLAMLWLLASIGIAAMVGVMITAANAHDAPMGWSYSVACCSGYDCDELPEGTVRETPNGYEITLQPGQHPMVTDKPFHAVVPYDSKKLRDAPDGRYHACILRTGTLVCLYVGSRGF